MAIDQQYNVWMCDRTYAKLTKLDVTSLAYTQAINGFADASFTIQNQSPSAVSAGLDLAQSTYNCIIETASGTERFRGEVSIVDEPTNATPFGYSLDEADGNLDRIKFGGSSILFNLNYMIVTPDTGSTVLKKSFTTGTKLGDAFTALINEAIARSPTSIQGLTLGTVENPIDSTGAFITLDSIMALYAANYYDWVNTLAQLGNADFYVTNNRINFVKRIGIDRSGTVILRCRKGEVGNELTGIKPSIDRRRMTNRVIVAGTQNGIITVAGTAEDLTSQSKHGFKEDVYPSLFGYQDTATSVTNYAKSLLTKLKADINADSLRIYPRQDHVLFGNFNLGDTIMVDVNWGLISFRKPVRVIGVSVTVDDVGVERIYYNIQEPIVTV